MTQLAVRDGADIIEQVIAKGDLKDLSPAERTTYYREVCRSLGLNELTRPFEYITLNGKLTLYARKDATDQLRTLQGVSIGKLERERLDDLYVVTAYATNAKGRQDSAIGAVNVKGLAGENLANALMKAETKAKRRVTLSLCGLGWSDETEVESIPYAQTMVVDHTTGEVLEQAPAYVPTREQDREDAPARRPRSRDELVDRYALLVGEAHDKDIELDGNEWALAHNATPDDIKRKGKALKALIDARDAGGDGSEERPF